MEGRYLRIGGALTLLAAALSFTLTEGTSLERYTYFLGYSLSLAVFGLFCTLKLKENKGARTFLGVACAIIPAHFAQLGAFVYAEAYGVAENLPELFTFSSPGTTATVSMVAIVSALTTGMAYLSFSVFARSQAKLLTTSYLVLNALILVPVREEYTILLLGLLMLIGAFYVDNFYLLKDKTLKSFEGHCARAMLYAPYLVVMGRNYLHSSELISATLLTTLGGILYWLSIERKSSVLQGYGAVLGIIGTCWLSTLTTLPLFDDMLLPGVIAPVFAVMLLMGRLSFSGGENFRQLAALGVACFGSLVILNDEAAINGITMAALGLVTLYYREEKNCFIFSLYNIAFGAVFAVRFAFEWQWLTLGVIGTVVVFASSAVESLKCRNASDSSMV